MNSAEPLKRRLFTTAHAAHVILGGTDAKAFWGFTFEDFVDQLQVAMTRHIGDPSNMPWSRHIDYTTGDYIELDRALSRLDFVQDPANHLDLAMATEFARRCDIVGMHGGVNGIGVGKDSVADALKPHGFVSLAFADALKTSVSINYGIPMRYFTERALKQEPLPGSQLSPRRVMQLWGTEIGRSITDRLWLQRHLLRVASAVLDLAAIAKRLPQCVSAANGIRVAVPDVRFANESAHLKELGGFNAWISRPSLAPVAASLSHGHSSEAGIPKHPSDLHLVNEGPLERFQTEAARAVLARFEPKAIPSARPGSRPRP